MYEPCGLTRCTRCAADAARREVDGGLVDTVTPYDGTNRDAATDGSTQSEELIWQPGWNVDAEGCARKTLQQNGMEHDFSWRRSARNTKRFMSRIADDRAGTLECRMNCQVGTALIGPSCSRRYAPVDSAVKGRHWRRSRCVHARIENVENATDTKSPSRRSCRLAR
jgi:hypothetical protein